MHTYTHTHIHTYIWLIACVRGLLVYEHRPIDLSQGVPFEHRHHTRGVSAVPTGNCFACLFKRIRSLSMQLPTLTGTWDMQLMSCWANRHLTARLANELTSDLDLLVDVQPADELLDRSCRMELSCPSASGAWRGPWLEARSGQAYLAGLLAKHPPRPEPHQESLVVPRRLQT